MMNLGLKNWIKTPYPFTQMSVQKFYIEVNIFLLKGFSSWVSSCFKYMYVSYYIFQYIILKSYRLVGISTSIMRAMIIASRRRGKSMFDYENKVSIKDKMWGIVYMLT